MANPCCRALFLEPFPLGETALCMALLVNSDMDGYDE
jgi:hypothetical protein